MSFSAGSCLAVLSTVIVLARAIISYAGYLKARKDGVSRSEIILNMAGGADKLLKRSKAARWLAYAFIFGPLIIFAFPSKQFANSVVVVILLEVVLFPVGLLLLWDSRNSRRIVEAKNSERAHT
ncbi:MAG TPA: hypothetical protein VNX00_14130 [Herbaspirillum sp.]|jgi:hypothetical protein|nr:hypothetical protein [Herbaspirillum sp.]